MTAIHARLFEQALLYDGIYWQQRRWRRWWRFVTVSDQRCPQCARSNLSGLSTESELSGVRET